LELAGTDGIFRTSQDVLTLDTQMEFLELVGERQSGWNKSFWCYALHSKQEIGLFAVDDAVFHHKGNFLQNGNVVERIAGNGNYIGGVAGLQHADFILPAQ
jgi:hypothetical protein